jgi:CheY-like chemotaxis protein
MAHFLVADDESSVRKSFINLLDDLDHTYTEAGNVVEIVAAVQESEKDNNEPFDLILLDYDLGGSTGQDAIKHISKWMGSDYCDHRFIVITGSSRKNLPSEFASLGAISHLLKPVSANQFSATIEHALVKRELFVHQKNDWESALELLSEIGIIENVEKLQVVSQQLEELQYIYNQLLEDLKNSRNEEQVAYAYASASSALNHSGDSFDALFLIIEPYGYTQGFIKDVKETYERNRLLFLSLLTYLNRLTIRQSLVPEKCLSPGACGHFEYRIGRNHRLYFRKNESRKIFERFGHKNIQEDIIRYLNGSTQADASETVLTK